MLTLKTKNREFVDLINGLFNVQDLQGVRFGLIVSKNIRVLQQELEDLEEKLVQLENRCLYEDKIKFHCILLKIDFSSIE